MTDGPSFGGELRRLRTAAGLSLADLERAVHYSKGHLSKIENGGKTAGRALAAQCDAALGTGGRLVALVDARPAAAPRAGDPEDRAEPPTPIRALAAGGEASAAVFESLFAQHRTLGLAVSPWAVRPMVETQTRILLALATAAREPARTRLLGLAARHTEYAGWMAQEAGDDRAALAWTRQAAQLAESVGDPELARYALVRQAELSLFRDDVRAAVRLSVQAQEDSRTARVTGLAVQREAQAHARGGDARRWRSAMDRATDLLAAPDETGGALGPSSAPNLNALVHGWCLLDLGRPEEAAAVLDREVPLIPAAARRSAARFGARRAIAHAAAGDPGRAAALALDLLPTATQVDSATVRTDLRRLWKELARWDRRPGIALTRIELGDALLPY